MPQCKCGGDAPSEMKAFEEITPQGVKAAQEYAMGKQPEYMPCIVFKHRCKSCGFTGVRIGYHPNGITGNSVVPPNPPGEHLVADILKPKSKKPKKKESKSRRLW